MGYQWLVNGVPIEGATASVLEVNVSQAAPMMKVSFLGFTFRRPKGRKARRDSFYYWRRYYRRNFGPTYQCVATA